MSSNEQSHAGRDGKPTLADRLRSVCVGTRQDLEVTRHLFRGRPAYLVRDPMTLQSHRLDPDDYAVFVAIDPARTLGEIFETLAERGTVTRSDEPAFYRFVFTLHQLGFLSLPIANDKLLYDRYIAKRKARRTKTLLNLFFLRIPLINPDPMLTRTVNATRFLFTRWFFRLWLGLVTAAVYIGYRNWDALTEPLEGILPTHNVPLLALTLVTLKLLHELGHAYACKHLGGAVPEMGVYLIVGAPCAYMDATASWSFTRKRDRILVALAGMYVELLCAAVAMFVWVLSPPGLIHDIAFNVVFLAGIVTVLFNVNPLMRYDGYYILSDWLEIPNLRQRATAYILTLAKRITLGVGQLPSVQVRERVLLVVYGSAAGVYRVLLIAAIAILLATRVSIIGPILAAGYFGSVGVAKLHRLIKYLLSAKETAPVRVRSVAVCVLLLIVIPVVVLLLPYRPTVTVAGVVGARRETIVRAGVDGFVHRAVTPLGRRVGPGDVLVELRSDAIDEALSDVASRIEASTIRWDAYAALAPVDAQMEQDRLDALRIEQKQREADRARLVVSAEHAGRVVWSLRARDVGRFVQAGEPIATVIDGPWEIRVLLTEGQMLDAKPAAGDRCDVRNPARPDVTMRGFIRRVAPAGSTLVQDDALTQIGGGEIRVDPYAMEAAEPFFAVVVELDRTHGSRLRHGMTCRLRFFGSRRPLGLTLLRRVLRFANKLAQG